MNFAGNIGNAPNPSGLTFPATVALDTVNHRLFVADDSNNRVLVFSLSVTNDFAGAGGSRVPAFVLGQSSFTTSTRATTQNGMAAPVAISVDAAGNRIFVADAGNNRVLVFSTAAITNGMNASNVLGQAGFTTSTVATSANGVSLSSGAGLAFDAAQNRLFVADAGNNRVVVFGTAAITDGMAASNVVGQATFATSVAATTATGMSSPVDVAYDAAGGGRLFLADGQNNRVLVFTGAITNGMAASHVLGQSTFTTSFPGGAATGMFSPGGLGYDATNNRLYVSDSVNHRVLAFGTTAITDGMAASNVLGEPDFVSFGGAVTASGMNFPEGLAVDPTNNRLFVADTFNNRVLLFDTTAITDGMAAADGLGQLDGVGAMGFTRNASNGPPASSSLYAPFGTALDTAGHRLFVADELNNRVLVFGLSPSNDFTGVGRAAAFVLGQSDFISAVGTTTAAGMSFPQGLAFDAPGNRLFVGDSGNSRVLVFSTAAITNGMVASNVLGKPDFVTSQGVLSATNLTFPAGLALDSANNRLFVADQGYNRILVFGTTTITDGMAALNVLGQPDFVSGPSGNTASQMSSPGGVAYDGATVGLNRLFVADSLNNRVLVFENAATLTDGEAASEVLGQAGFGLSAQTTTQSGMFSPAALAFDGSRQRIFVADTGNDRVLIFATSALSNGANATSVFGQPDFTTAAPATGVTGLFGGGGIGFDPVQNRFFVVDTGNNRVLLVNAP